MNDEEKRLKKAKEIAEKSSKRLFGNRTKGQEEALKNIRTIGSPENLVRPDKEDE